MASFSALEVVTFGTPVAVNTPVGILVVVCPLCRVVVSGCVVIGGAELIMLLGDVPGKPANSLKLGSGTFQSASSSYKTPLMITPALFASIFLCPVLQVALVALTKHLGPAAAGAMLV